jgi:hypothetical protein
VATAASAVHKAAAASEVEQRIRTASAIIVVPSSDPAGGPGGPQRPSPELDSQRRLALLGWAHHVELVLQRCLPGPARARRLTALEVSFFPEQRTPDESQQRLRASRIALPPRELQRLSSETPPGELEACLARARSVPLSVVVGDAASHGFPSSTEHIVVEL